MRRLSLAHMRSEDIIPVPLKALLSLPPQEGGGGGNGVCLYMCETHTLEVVGFGISVAG